MKSSLIIYGNVREWVQDRYEYDSYPDPRGYRYLVSEYIEDPTGPLWGEKRVARGGSWESVAGQARNASRWGLSGSSSSMTLGFRLVRSSRRNRA